MQTKKNFNVQSDENLSFDEKNFQRQTRRLTGQVSHHSAVNLSEKRDLVVRFDDEIQRIESSSRPRRSPSELRVNLFPADEIHFRNDFDQSQIEISSSSDPSLIENKPNKQKRSEALRNALLDHRLGRRIHSSLSSSNVLRPSLRRRSTQNVFARQRRNLGTLRKNSKWRIVQNRLHEIAMLSEPFAKRTAAEKDFRWILLREQIRRQILDIREMSLLRQQEEGTIDKKKALKRKFDIKTIPLDEVLHIECEGRVHTLNTRDLLLGRLLSDDQIELDTVAQLYARRQIQVQRKLLKRQEGRTRLKKKIAFSFCLFNLSFIIIMSTLMFVCATRILLILGSQEVFD